MVDLQILIRGRGVPHISAHIKIGGGIIAALVYCLRYFH